MSLIDRLSIREKTLLALAAVVLIAAFAYNFVFAEIVAQSRSLSGQIAIRETLLTKNLALITQRETIETEYARLASYLRADAGDYRSASQALRTIQSIAGRDIDLENIKPLESRVVGAARLHEFEIRGRADKARLVQFLYKIATSREALSVRNLTVNSTSTGELRYSMVIAKLQIR